MSTQQAVELNKFSQVIFTQPIDQTFSLYLSPFSHRQIDSEIENTKISLNENFSRFCFFTFCVFRFRRVFEAWNLWFHRWHVGPRSAVESFTKLDTDRDKCSNASTASAFVVDSHPFFRFDFNSKSFGDFFGTSRKLFRMWNSRLVYTKLSSTKFLLLFPSSQT